MRILITGANGLVGTALRNHCSDIGDTVLSYDHASFDITDSELVNRVILEHRPEAVVNCAAWTDVDACETNPDRARRSNALGPQNLAHACRKADAVLVTISTDYVFDGTKDGFYTQRDTPAPLSVYGQSKWEGERLVQAEYGRSIVVRTGFIFGLGGKTFLSRVVDLVRGGNKIQAICDQCGTPTYAPDLAERLRHLAALDLPGIFHVVNSGAGATYEEFARTALRLAELGDESIVTVPMSALKRPAPRPANSKLRCLLSEAIGLQPLPTWEDGLQRFVAKLARA